MAPRSGCLWLDFQRLRSRQDVDAQAVTAREFIVPLLRDVLGFADLDRAPAIEQAGHRYPIGHAALGGRVPLVFAAHDQPLDTPAERFGDPNPDTGKVRRRSPFMLAQEALNASDTSLWAVVTNGLRLRILRDNPSLTRPAYLEVDLEAVFSEERYADFTAFWLLTHASRFGAAQGEKPGGPEDCPWERWRVAGQEAGVAIRRNLRYQVTEALRALGTGFLSHPDNAGLRESIQTEGEAGKQAFFEELLRLVYRFIFLATVEDRLDPATGVKLVFAPATPAAIQQRYLAGYSLTWLRERAARRSQHDRHGDLWQALGITFAALARGEPALGLPALGGLFDADQCPRLDGAQLENRWLLAAIFQLGYFRDTTGLSRVNYRDMKFEELGSVYESLLELVPALQGLAHPAHARLAFVGDDSDSDANNRGNTRKLTGSYYTPDSLVQELIRSVLEPVIANTVKANPERPVEALLELTICDPACGSGHFLVAAALRLGDEIALQRAAVERDGGVPTPLDLRHARRDVVSRCLFGIDKNPMAIQLAKTALWLEAYTPDLPLSFIDHHLRVGDALLGVLDPKVLENGIPDEAYGALSGDDKAVASLLKKQNKADLKSWQAIATGDLFTRAGLAAQAVTVDRLADDTAGHVAAKRAAWQQAQGTAQRSILARLADAYVAAFLAPKLTGADAIVPLSGYLWGVLSGQPTNDEVEDTAHALCRKYGVFHWWLAFPQVAAKGGFSVMLGNPPWEQLQLSEEEFFASRAPSIAALAGDKRKQAITSLETDAPWLWSAFQNAKRQYDAANQFLRAGGRFPLTAVGKLNTYALFAEVFLQATRGNGRAGFIVPTGIATDDSTKAYFGHIAAGGRLASLYDFENREAVFPAIDSRIKFSLLTLGAAPEAAFICFATRASQLADPRRRFTLTPDEFSLINPNTRTCPVFRSERDAELTKKLYRAAPVLIEEEVRGADGQMLKPELNPWGLTFSQGLFNMTSDSSLFHGEPGSPGVPRRLPLYEAKMIHHFDHRWATYVDADGKPGEVETTDVTLVQKTDPDFTVRPRYWVDEREVLARIARAPARVAKAWLALHAATPRTIDDALSDLLLTLAAWVAGELFSRAAGESSTDDGWTPQRGLPYIAPTEAQLKARYAPLSQALLGSGLTTRKALVEFPKWAAQNRDVRLSDAELAELETALQTANLAPVLLSLLDTWMDARSPRWLMGWRDITNATNERTVIASVVPRVGTGDTLLLMFPDPALGARLAALLADQCSLVHDFVARQKVGGTHLKYHVKKQLVHLPPERYTAQALDFIVPRVLELTYTAHDLSAWAADLAEYDPRRGAGRGQPFPWSDGKSAERRARLRAELDACYARLYGLNRDELRYILDPADVMGTDYPSETFRVLKEGEFRAYGEYHTRRLVLEAWDRMATGDFH